MRAFVSDHALVRYLERAKGIDLNDVRTEILEHCVAAMNLGYRAAPSEFGTFIMNPEIRHVKTLLEPTMRPKERDRRADKEILGCHIVHVVAADRSPLEDTGT